MGVTVDQPRGDPLTREIDNLTGDSIRPATAEERAESIDAARFDGGAGVIEIDGRPCYVED